MSEMEQLHTYIDNIPLEYVYTKYSETVIGILSKLEKAMESFSLSEIVNGLLVRALERQSFAIKVSLMCDPQIIGIIDRNSNSLRQLLFQFLQKDYQARKESNSTDRSVLRNATSLMGEVYNRYIVAGQNFEYLAAPLISYLEMILKSSFEEDIKVAVRQISIHGKSLFEQAQSQMKNLTF